jgi:hypothetical protein
MVIKRVKQACIDTGPVVNRSEPSVGDRRVLKVQTPDPPAMPGQETPKESSLMEQPLKLTLNPSLLPILPTYPGNRSRTGALPPSALASAIRLWPERLYSSIGTGKACE